MNSNTRTHNFKLNLLFGYFAQIGILILSFIGRKIFLNYLSVDYLGINGLYSNVLTILSLAELGLDSAVVYSLYKPVAENDTILIHSLLVYFKKIYTYLALGLFGLGVALIPFLRFLVNSDISDSDLIIYYILFLINTVSSYFVAHKVALLSAAQEQRTQKIVTLSLNIFLQMAHILVLVIFGNFYAYVIATVLTTILTNITLGIVVEHQHPEVFTGKEIVTFDKEPIKKRIYSTFLYKIGAVMINSTDNILISVLVSTLAVGLYSNYYTIISGISGFIAIITSSIISGVGNLAVREKKEKQCIIFDIILLSYHTVSAIGFIGIYLLINDVITIWLGSKYIFDENTVCIIAINFYLTTAISPVWMFREANGFFERVKYLLLIRAVINIILSIALGKIYGVLGVFLATAISLLLTNFWYEPTIISKQILGRKQSIYWKKQIKYAVITMVSFYISHQIVKLLPNTLITLLIKTIIICIITLIVFSLTCCRTQEFKGLIARFIHRKK